MTKKLLVADDSSTIQKVIKIAFARYDVKVVEASSFADAMALAIAQKPDGIIADANLAGTQLPVDLKKLQDAAGGVPTLLLVGSFESVDLSAVKALGLNKVLHKPFDTKDIIRMVTVDLGLVIEHSVVASEGEGKVRRGVASSSFSSPMNEYSSPELQMSIDELVAAEIDEGLRSQTNILASESAPTPHFVDTTVKGTRAFAGPGAGALQSQQPSTGAKAASQQTKPITEGPKAGILGERSTRERAAVLPPEPAQVAQPLPPIQGAAPISREEIRQWITPLLRDEVKAAVKEAVVAYCALHFADLAREVIIQELRRLAEERSKHLADP